MRLEWLPIVRNRAWHEFETLAKTDPSCLLYETVVELEQGLPDREDRFRLGQVLKHLQAQGYGEHDLDAPKARPYQPRHPYRLGEISSSEHVGLHMIIAVFRVDREIITVALQDTPAADCCRVHTTIKQSRISPLNRSNTTKSNPFGFDFMREFPFEYVCHRIETVLSRKSPEDGPDETLHRAMRHIKKHARPVPHPADYFEIPKMDDDELRTRWRFDSITKDWLIFLGEEISCSVEVAKTAVNLKMSVEARAELRYQLYRETLSEFTRPEQIQFLANRFKDLAHIYACRNRFEEALPMAGLGRSIEEYGPDSPVYDAMLRHTAKVIPAHLSEPLKQKAAS